MLERIEELMKAIGKKHNTYCNFTVRSGHGKGGTNDYANSVDYNTYISGEPICSAHEVFKTIDEVVNRFDSYLAIDDLLAENRDMAQERLKTLHEQREDIEDNIKEIEAILLKP
jgi:hypothetical protein